MSTRKSEQVLGKRKYDRDNVSPPHEKITEVQILSIINEFIAVEVLPPIILSWFKCPVCGICDLNLFSCSRFWMSEHASTAAPVLCRSCIDFFPASYVRVIEFAYPPLSPHKYLQLCFDNPHALFSIEDATTLHDRYSHYECEFYSEWGLGRNQWRSQESTLLYAKTLILRLYSWMKTVCGTEFVRAMEEMRVAFEQFESEARFVLAP
jgi:hypothetical protein